MLYSIKHTTSYTYTDNVPLCHNLAILSPRHTSSQQIHSFNLDISPLPQILEEYVDFFGNKVYYFVIEQDHKQLSVTATSTIESKTPEWRTKTINTLNWEAFKKQLQSFNLGNELSAIKQFAFPTDVTEATPSILDYAKKSFTPNRSLFEATVDLTERIYTDFKYTAGFTTISTPLSVVMKERKGVCQDFAHLAIACLQSVGLAARYISGYLETIPPAGKPKLIGSDASHAWFSVYIPDMGWVDFDPTNNKHPDQQYLTIGWGRNYFDVIPLRGIIQSSRKHKLEVAVDVTKLQNPNT